MNAYLVGAAVLTAALLPLMVFCVRAPVVEGLVALELAGTLVTIVMLLLAAGTDRQPFFDLALVSAVLSFAGGLVFVRFLERWV